MGGPAAGRHAGRAIDGQLRTLILHPSACDPGALRTARKTSILRLFSDAALTPPARTSAHQRLHEQVYEQLAAWLVTGHFSPGEKITLRSLAKVLKTSLVPIRDALQRLASTGAIVVTESRRMMVPKLSAEDVVELREVRIALEVISARRAALRADAADLGLLELHYQDMKYAAVRGETADYLKSHWAFHQQIGLASGSALLLSILEPLWLRIGPTVRLTKPDQEALIRSLRGHWVTFEAIARGDADAAAEAITNDIAGCFRDLLTLPNRQIEVLAAKAAPAETAPRAGAHLLGIGVNPAP